MSAVEFCGMQYSQGVVSSTPDVRAFMSRAGFQAPIVQPHSSNAFLVRAGTTNQVAMIKSREEQFFRAMERFRSQPGRASSVGHLDLRTGHHTWQSVLLTAKEANDGYEAKRKGLKNVFTRLGRKLGQQEPLLEPVLNILPCGEYTSVACGSLKLLFAACGQMNKIREEVMNALDEAPYHLQQAESLQMIYRSDQRLVSLTEDLYVALLNAIEGIIEWYSHGKMDRFLVIFQQGAYGGEHQVRFQAVHAKAKGLLEHAEMLDKLTTVQVQHMTWEMIGNINILSQQNHDLRELMMAHNSKHSQQLGENLEMTKKLSEGIDRFAAGQTCLLQDTFARLLVTTEEKMRIERENAQEKQARHELQRKYDRMQAEVQALQQRQRSIALRPDELLTWLAVPIMEGDNHLEELIVSARMFNADPSLAEAITTSSKFVDWFTSAISQMLFIDPGGELSLMSPGSYVTAFLVRTLQQRPHAIVLKHFCSRDQHLPSESIVTQLLADLISQLLQAQPDINLADWTDQKTPQDHQYDLQTRNLSYLCSFFKYLITRIPYGTIFVLIDDFHRLERDADPQHLRYMYQKFGETIDLCSTPQAPARVLKILFMTASRGMRGVISSEVPDEQILSLGMLDRDDFGMPALSMFAEDSYAFGPRGFGMPAF